ncbi:MATE family efflux transporter [Gemmiger formicilis]|uniref:MATE family efflux transporter n=1 Tax=Gemmiger formicilis TaxID=745368 RepID=UPI00195D8BCD|nr:MATE family efflux transporter [Gemmiger formicilis]MBM6916234.1 MATE family efflux transporter [Gemmiger formicilis]
MLHLPARKPVPEGYLFSNEALMALMVPLVIEQFLAAAVGMADTMMVSRAGEAAISGVSLVDMINKLIFQLLAALATGGAVVTSQFLGARARHKASDSAGQLVLLSALAGTGIMLFTLALAHPMMRLFFGQITDDVMAAGLLYLRIVALSYPFLALYNAGAALFRSMGNSKVSMQVSVLVNVLNVIGNAICVFGLGMGVAGVAIPSLISYIVGAALMLWLLRSPDMPLPVGFTIRLRGDMARSILGIGIPSAMENSVFQLGRIVVVSMISLSGTVQIAANAVANNLDGLAIIPGQAYELAMIAVVGRCIGARDMRQARYYTGRLMKGSYLSLAAVSLVMLAGLPLLLGLYEISDATWQLAWLLVVIHLTVGMLIWPASFVLPCALRAANDVKFPMWVSILSMAIWRLGFSYLLAVRMEWGAVGVWIAMVVDWVCRTICFAGRWKSGRWEHFYKEKETV